jgi:hypothetical protein
LLTDADFFDGGFGSAEMAFLLEFWCFGDGFLWTECGESYGKRGFKNAVISGFEGGQIGSVAEHEGEEFAGVPVAGDVAFGLGERAEEPA